MIKINSIGEAKRILSQMHPRKAGVSELELYDLKRASIRNFHFENPDHKSNIIEYIAIQHDYKLDGVFKCD